MLWQHVQRSVNVQHPVPGGSGVRGVGGGEEGGQVLSWYEVSPEGDTLRLAEARSVHPPLVSHVTYWHADLARHAGWAAARVYTVLWPSA